jgi:hypothetical protein
MTWLCAFAGGYNGEASEGSSDATPPPRIAGAQIGMPAMLAAAILSRGTGRVVDEGYPMSDAATELMVKFILESASRWATS